MLVEAAAADAYAIPFEFVPHTGDRPNDLSGYHQHPTYADMVPGHYTDDTQRSIANAQWLLDCEAGYDHLPRTNLFNPYWYGTRLQATFKQDPRPGYSRRFEAFLHENFHDEDLALKVQRKPSNGSIMGVAPLGYLGKIAEVRLAAAAQALSTHSYVTVPFAEIVALSAHYMIYRVGKLDDLVPWLRTELEPSAPDTLPRFFDAVWMQAPTETKMSASSTCGNFLRLLTANRSLSEVIWQAVDLGGDTDSLAAITVAVASQSSEYTNDIPTVLMDGLENDKFGRDYLADLDAQLTQYAEGSQDAIT